MWRTSQGIIRIGRLALLLAVPCTLSLEAGATGGPGWSHKLDPFLSRIARGTTLTRTNGEVLALAPGTQPLRRSLPHMMRSQVLDNRHWVFVHVGLRGGSSHYDGLTRLIARLGGQVRGRVGNVWSVFVPASAVAELARSDTVGWM